MAGVHGWRKEELGGGCLKNMDWTSCGNRFDCLSVTSAYKSLPSACASPLTCKIVSGVQFYLVATSFHDLHGDVTRLSIVPAVINNDVSTSGYAIMRARPSPRPHESTDAWEENCLIRPSLGIATHRALQVDDLW